MATLQAIGFNALTGAIIGTITLTAFGSAIRWGSASVHAQLAPRVWSRPRNVLQNVLPRPYGISWIPWALKLSYQGENMNSFRREDHGETFDFSKVLSHVVLSSINNVAYIISSPSFKINLKFQSYWMVSLELGQE